jgi:hypothetical protein
MTVRINKISLLQLCVRVTPRVDLRNPLARLAAR